MYIPLILFFISFVGISIMIGRKVFLLRTNRLENIESFPAKIPDLEEVKYVTLKKIKGYGYIILVITIRSYVRSSIFLKKTGKELHKRIKTKLSRNRHRFSGNSGEKQEVSKFLKGISEYKQKIKRIKHQIMEEEKNK